MNVSITWPERVWERTGDSKWTSRPVTPADRARRREAEDELGGNRKAAA